MLLKETDTVNKLTMKGSQKILILLIVQVQNKPQ